MSKSKIGALFLVVLATFSSLSCAGTCDSLDSLDWLLGEWVAEDGNRRTLEAWKAVSSATFEGAGETRSRDADERLSLESLRLVEMSGEIYYIAKVRHNDLPVAFRLTECPDGGAVFENPGHDFPKRLQYRLVGEGQLVVTVSNGQGEGFEVRFHRENGDGPVDTRGGN